LRRSVRSWLLLDAAFPIQNPSWLIKLKAVEVLGLACMILMFGVLLRKFFD